MPSLKMPTLMRYYVENQVEVVLRGDTVGRCHSRLGGSQAGSLSAVESAKDTVGPHHGAGRQAQGLPGTVLFPERY